MGASFVGNYQFASIFVAGTAFARTTTVYSGTIGGCFSLARKLTG
jgi:hypothetical protein